MERRRGNASSIDAGCGRGHLTDSLRRCGHRAVGVDSSPTAIAWAREAYGPHFEVATLDAYRPTTTADVVLCLDVLFHVLDDGVWQSSLRALARYAAAESILILTDVFADERQTVQRHIVHRTVAEYDAALSEHDFVRRELNSYGFGSNDNVFAVYQRRA